MGNRRWVPILAVLGLFIGCGGGKDTGTAGSAAAGDSGVVTFADDVKFLEEHMNDLIVLGGGNGPAIAVAPAYQGRVMTSTSNARSGVGNGFINYDFIKSGELVPHINVFGGEDRFWIGPEGGQFGIFFKEGDEFIFDDWQTPELIDTAPYAVVSQSDTEVSFEAGGTLENYSGTVFNVGIERSVRLLDADDVERFLGVRPSDKLSMVAYESKSTLSNTGDTAWTRETGLLSIWILGMFKHSDTTVVTIPFVAGPEEELGNKVNDEYFGKVPEDRLVVRDDVLFFKADGAYRSKIGIGPQRALSFAGSYDPFRQLLTIVEYTLPEGATDYVNSMWEIQDEPYGGDVVNSYNDGPPSEDEPPLGPFYELESSSPAIAIGPGESVTHYHRTFHFIGPQPQLQEIATATLGVDLNLVVAAMAGGVRG